MMHARTRLVQIATTCSQAPSMKLRTDADTLLKLAQQLDEQSAAIYLNSFCKKWGLDPLGSPAAVEAAVNPSLARRAPQGDELEGQILARLETREAEPEDHEIEVRFEGIDDAAMAH